MNYYFKTYQNRQNIDWEELIGISNFDVSYKEFYNYSKLYIENVQPSDIKNVSLQFYKRKNDSEINWDKEIPKRIRRIHIESVAFVSINNPIFMGLESLYIINCNINIFPWRSIPVTLRHINLSKNNLCGHISLSHTKNLRFIYLSENYIESLDLPYDCNTADVSYNKCKFIEFYNPLMFANFSWNNLSDFKGSKWMERCNLSHNSLKNVDFSQSNKIGDINLSFNNLTNTLNFGNCKLLKKINISHNKVKNVDGIEFLGELESFDASHNDIETFIVPIIRRVNIQNNPLQYFEWLVEPVSDGKGGFNFTDFLNGDNPNSNPLLNMASNFLQDKLKMNKIDEMYGSKLPNMHRDKRIEKKYIDLSSTNIQEFPETSIIQKSNQINVELHILFYKNDFIEFPYHPKCHIHVGRMQMHNWKKISTHLETKLNQLENQEFFIIDSE